MLEPCEKSWDIVNQHYQMRGWSHAYKLYERFLENSIDKSACVLDVGCGRTFPLADHLLKIARDVHGIDPEMTFDFNRPNLNVRAAAIEKIPYPDAVFDAVVSRCVLEHLQNPIDAFREISRVLRPGGRFLFLTANKFDYISLAAMMVPNRLHPVIIRCLEGRTPDHTFPTYFRANSVRKITRLAFEAGLCGEKIDYHCNYPSMFMFSPFICRLAISYDELIRKIRPLNFLQSWLIGSLQKMDQR